MYINLRLILGKEKLETNPELWSTPICHLILSCNKLILSTYDYISLVLICNFLMLYTTIFLFHIPFLQKDLEQIGVLQSVMQAFPFQRLDGV